MGGILFIDTETTGFPKLELGPTEPGQPYVVQLAAILTNDKGEVLEEFCGLVRPRSWVIPPEAQKVHGISTEKCQAEGAPVGDLLNKLDKLAYAADLIVAHNIEFDLFVLGCEYERALRFPPFTGLRKCCTMKETTDIVRLPHRTREGEFKWPNLGEAYRFFVGKELVGAHDAMVDAKACSEIYFKCRAELEARERTE